MIYSQDTEQLRQNVSLIQVGVMDVTQTCSSMYSADSLFWMNTINLMRYSMFYNKNNLLWLANFGKYTLG